MDQRAEKHGAKIRGVYYRRVLWLLVIGLIHSYLIWWGDILVLYAECGLFLYFFRNLKPWTLIVLGLLAMLIIVPLVLGFAKTIEYMKAASDRTRPRPRLARSTAESTTCCTTTGPRICGTRFCQYREEGQRLG